MSFQEFIFEYYVWILAILLVLIITIIGFIADKRKKLKLEKEGEKMNEQQNIMPDMQNSQAQMPSMDMNVVNNNQNMGNVADVNLNMQAEQQGVVNANAIPQVMPTMEPAPDMTVQPQVMPAVNQPQVSPVAEVTPVSPIQEPVMPAMSQMQPSVDTSNGFVQPESIVPVQPASPVVDANLGFVPIEEQKPTIEPSFTNDLNSMVTPSMPNIGGQPMSTMTPEQNVISQPVNPSVEPTMSTIEPMMGPTMQALQQDYIQPVMDNMVAQPSPIPSPQPIVQQPIGQPAPNMQMPNQEPTQSNQNIWQ